MQLNLQYKTWLSDHISLAQPPFKPRRALTLKFQCTHFVNYILVSPPQPWPSVSDPAKHFVERILTVDPSKRLTAGQALKHPWITSMAASSSMKNLQRCISQNLLKRASSRCHSTKSAQSTRSRCSTKSNKARRVREKELRELNRRYQQQYNGWNYERDIKSTTAATVAELFKGNSTTTELLQWLS